MRKSVLLLILILVSCQKDNDEVIEEVAFECAVESISFISDTEAAVTFRISLETIQRFYAVNENLVTDKAGSFTIGNDLVHIDNWTEIDASNATFDFYYGENLGFFCMDEFSAIPNHDHENFEGSAIKVESGKAVGKWKIKKIRILEKNKSYSSSS
jgi:hypothetical protein